MQYVGRFVSSVYNTITPNINPATLSGAIDVIVVEREVEKEVEDEDGSGKKKTIKVTELASTPFHVRFGKMSVLRPAERKVTLHLNDSPEPLPFAMKVGEAGEAFFVLELNDEEARQGVPDELVTSPILSATTSPNIPADDEFKAKSDAKTQEITHDSHMQLTETHQPPRKLIAENYVEPLDLGASRTSSTNPSDSHKPKTDVDSKTTVNEAEQEVIPTLKTKGQKETLQYMLDMDGYKMTEDGEEIAFKESSRLADEVPISKRHGLPLADNVGASIRSRPSQRRGSFGDVEGKSLGGNTTSDSIQKRRGSFTVGMNGSSDDSVVRDGEPSLVEAQSTTDSTNSTSPARINHTSKALGKEISGWSAPGSLPRTSTDPLLDTRSLAKNGDEAGKKKVTPPRRAATMIETSKQQKTYAKTLRLTSDQLKSLDLKKGANTISFSVTSSYSGVAMCTARIFLWDSTHRIVVSDIDGTITKSDALGHLYTMIGRDWTHTGVAKLYTDVARNGYRIMYLTSRAIGQADSTRDYLRGINQGNFRLPDGPVIMSPDRLMASLHREVILRKPEVFKMACLRDIARLFGVDQRTSGFNGSNLQAGATSSRDKEADNLTTPNDQNPLSIASVTSTNQNSQPTPFYAGFGNRITDALSYRSVNIPSSRIFTIDSNGEVKMDLLKLAGYKSSYIHMTDLVDQMFPPITAKSAEGNAGKPEFNDFNFWRPEVGEFELPPDEELIHTPAPSSPVSPALSARSIRSTKSARSAREDEYVTPKTNGTSTNSKSNGNANEDNSGNTGSTSRLSRFGLGKLGLSKRGSNQTIAAPPSQQENRTENESNISKSGPPTIASSPSSSSLLIGTSPPSSPGSYGSGVTSWTAGWRRRPAPPVAAQHQNGNVQATSPLVGPVINAENDDLDDDGEDDDDVSSFGGDEEEGDDDDDDYDEQGQDQRARRLGRKNNDRDEMGDDVMDDDDPLLATGEIQFEWRG